MLNEISLSKFLSRYCNLTGKDLSKVTHEDVKSLFPQLKSIKYEDLRKLLKEDPTIIATGRVLLVNDGRRTKPYYAPELQNQFMEGPQDFQISEVSNGPVYDDKKHDYTKMSIYELRLMLRHKFNSLSNQRNARYELESRGVVLSKKYNRVEEKRKTEKRIRDDRY